jgi:hypothetical protein
MVFPLSHHTTDRGNGRFVPAASRAKDRSDLTGDHVSTRVRQALLVSQAFADMRGNAYFAACFAMNARQKLSTRICDRQKPRPARFQSGLLESL